MARLIGFRETIRIIYQKYGSFIRAVAKAVLSFFVLYYLSRLFNYNSKINQVYIFVAISVIQAFLPISFLYYTGTALIAGNLFSLSPEIMLVFLAVVIASRLSFIYVEGSYSILVMLVPVLFFLKLEYFIPVLVGMIYGVGGVLPVLGGILIYYIGTCTQDVSVLLTASDGNGTGLGIQKIIQMFTMNREMFVVIIAFCLSVFITAILYRLFHERAWQLAVVFGNVSLAFVLLSGRLIFELDYPVWRVIVYCVLAAFVDAVYQFFRGIGDLGRIEKVTFEDDEYIYYVKAVPKFQLSQSDRSVTRIQPEDESEETDKKKSRSRREKKNRGRKDTGASEDAAGEVPSVHDAEAPEDAAGEAASVHDAEAVEDAAGETPSVHDAEAAEDEAGGIQDERPMEVPGDPAMEAQAGQESQVQDS